MTRILKSEGYRETKRSLEEKKKQNVGPVYTSKRDLVKFWTGF
jgi:hypothetical protein